MMLLHHASGFRFPKQTPHSRIRHRRQAYGAVESSLKAGGVLRGALFWEWLSDGELASESAFFGVSETDFTWQCAALLNPNGSILPGALR
jgi:hypothetical protein